MIVVDADEISAWAREHPQPNARQSYLGPDADPHGAPEEPHIRQIQTYARDGLAKTGIATQKPHLFARLAVDTSARRIAMPPPS